MSAHGFVRPGQVAADLPAPDACVRCGRPEGEHGSAETVYVVCDAWMFGKTVQGIYRNEVDALRAATAGSLPPGVTRRTVERFDVQS